MPSLGMPARRGIPHSPGGSVHVLVTGDTLSGSWTYTRELVTGLVTRGVRVTLVSFGEIPLPEQTSWMDHLHGLDYRPTAFRLEWMQEAEEDLPESSAFLAALVRELRPDVLHLNQFCYGNLPVDVPRVVMAHGDLITWSHAVHDRAPSRVARRCGITIPCCAALRAPTRWWRLRPGCLTASALATAGRSAEK